MLFVDVGVSPLYQVACLAAVILVSFGTFVVYGAGSSYYGHFLLLFTVECQVSSPSNVRGRVQVSDQLSSFFGELFCGACVPCA